MMINHILNKMNDAIKEEELDFDDFNNEAYSNSNIKQIKFKLLVEDISKALPDDISISIGISLGLAVGSMLFKVNEITPLNLFFNNNTENLYARIILEKVKFSASNWSNNYKIESLNNVAIKIKAIKDFIQEYRMPQNRKKSLVFIFWSLFILSVDDSSYSENLSLISDLSYLLKIDEEILSDIIQVIKVIFGDEDENFKFQTEEVPILFSEVLNLFR